MSQRSSPFPRIQAALVVILAGLSVARVAGAESYPAASNPAERSTTDGTSAPLPVDRRPSRRCALCGDERSYDVELAIPLWVPFVSGHLATGQKDTSNPDSSWGERLSVDSNLLFFFFGRLAARYGPSGLLIDSAGATFAEDISFTLTDGEIAKLSASAFLVRSAFTYRTPPIRLGHRPRPFLLTFVPYGGMRFVRITLDWTGIATDFSRHTLWVDPIVGSRVHVDFRNGLTFYVEGDVGGFTAGSTIAGWASAVIEYAFVDWFALGAGWNYYRFRQDIQAGDRSLDAAITVTGPQLTLSFHLR